MLGDMGTPRNPVRWRSVRIGILVPAAIVVCFGALACAAPASNALTVNELESRLADDPLIVEAFAEKKRIGIVEAKQKLRIESYGSLVVSEAMATLGDRFGGYWYDPGLGRYRVGVVDKEAAAEIINPLIHNGTHVYVDLVPVKWTLRELEGLQTRLVKALMKPDSPSDVAITVSQSTNSVVVEVANDVSAAKLSEIRSTFAGAAQDVDVVPVSRSRLTVNSNACSWPHCDRPLRGGVAIAPMGTSWHCTGGFVAVRPDNFAVKYMVTAGHCLHDYPSQTWKAFAPSYSGHWPMGPASTYFYDSRGDVGKIQIYSTNSGANYRWYTTTMVGRTAAWGNDEYLRVAQPAAYPAAGQLFCRYGRVTPFSCGFVTDPGPRSITYSNTGVTVGQVWLGDACALSGDSGGPATGYGNVPIGVFTGSGPPGGDPGSPCVSAPFAPPGWTSVASNIATVQGPLNAWIIWEP